jgi:hypothetical protein
MNKTTKFDLCINLVEDLVSRKGHYNSCMVIEIRDLMENYIVTVLLRGQTISLQKAFEFAWIELTDQDSMEMEDSYLIVR